MVFSVLLFWAVFFFVESDSLFWAAASGDLEGKLVEFFARYQLGNDGCVFGVELSKSLKNIAKITRIWTFGLSFLQTKH